MATERFTTEQFEKALTAVTDDYKLKWENLGYLGGELRYRVAISNSVFVLVNSTVGFRGIADDTGENSIRVWIVGSDNEPLGNKVGRWITRVAGWEDRLSDKMGFMIEMASEIQFCDKCGTHEKVFITKKEGPNKGRIFVKCNCPKSFTWLDFDNEEEHLKPVKADAKKAPVCPKCGGGMILRNRKDGSGKFYGCRLYPACHGTRDVEEKMKEIEVSFPTVTLPVVAQVDMALRGQPYTVPGVPEISKPKAFVASAYHEAIFAKVEDPNCKALLVEARAGSGKTTTGVEMLKLLNPSMDVVYVAFNKDIVKGLRVKTPQWVKVGTWHSLGLGACKNAFGKDLDVDKDHVYHILEGVLDKFMYGQLFTVIKKLVSLVKSNLSGTSAEELQTLADYYGVELNGDEETVFAAVQLVIDECMKVKDIIDYDDMIWLPIMLKLPVHKYDFMFVDEAQDTNKNQIAFAKMSLKETGRVVFVGDRFQSIYGFRGADAQAIPNIIESFNAEALPLTITYRNPKSIVELVRGKFPEVGLEAAPWAEEGEIRYVSYERALLEYSVGNMVLCRTNAPLVKPAFALIKRGIRAVIRGRDIGDGLVTLVKKMKAHDMSDLLKKLEEYRYKEVEKLQAAEKNQQAQAVEDKVETIAALSDGIFSISELELKIDSIFSDDSAGVVFSSVHRAKGLEAEMVYILEPGLMPHRMAKKEWEKVQERNIEYVALTRALKCLVYVN